MICKNCDNSFQGEYCNVCGQKASTHRYTWRAILNELPLKIFQLNNGFFLTIKDLILRPGQMIRDYLAGKRVRFSNPFWLLFTFGGINSLLYAKLHLQEVGTGVDVSQIEHSSIGVLAAKFFIIRGLLFMPIIAGYCHILFKDKKYTLPEYFVVTAYLVTVNFLFSILFSPLLLAAVRLDYYQEIRYFLVAVYLAYSFFTYFQFYEAKGNPLLILKILLLIAFTLFTMIFFNEVLIRPLIIQPI